MTNKRYRWVCWASVVALAGCGGATTDDTGSTTGPQAGQSQGGNAGTGQAGTGQAGTGQAGTGQAGSSGKGGAGQGGTGGQGSSGKAGSGASAGAGQAGSGQAGSGQAGQGQAGGGAAGAGQAGSGQAGQGQAGGGAAGAGASGGSGQGGSAPGCCTTDMDCGDLVPVECVNGSCAAPAPAGQCWRDADCGSGKTCQGASVCPCGAMCEVPDSPGTCVAPGAGWASCGGPGDCQLAFNTCCGVCGNPKPGDFDSVNHDKIAEHYSDVCPVPTSCPACANGTNNDLAAFCEAQTCQVVEISKDPISACDVDADCTVRLAKCCDCGIGQPEEYIAVRVQDYYTYDDQVCGPGGGGCPSDCAPGGTPPVQAYCSPKTKHCVVAPPPPDTAVCPVAPPQAGAACQTEGAACEYGEDVRPGCRPRANCTGGVWDLQQPKCPATPGQGESGCPADIKADGSVCIQKGLVCALAAGSICECTACLGGPCSDVAHWGCVAAPAAPCPVVAPDLGQPCSQEGTECSYGVFCSQTNTMRKCDKGLWTEESFACPQ